MGDGLICALVDRKPTGDIPPPVVIARVHRESAETRRATTRKDSMPTHVALPTQRERLSYHTWAHKTSSLQLTREREAKNANPPSRRHRLDKKREQINQESHSYIKQLFGKARCTLSFLLFFEPQAGPTSGRTQGIPPENTLPKGGVGW